MNIKEAKDALHKLSLDTVHMLETVGPRNVLRLFIKDVEASKPAPEKWIVQHNGKQAECDTLFSMLHAGQEMRTEAEQLVAAQKLMTAIDADLAEEAKIVSEEYELHQDDQWVAGTSGNRAYEEIMHYAAQYSQDGPVEIFKVTRTKVHYAKPE